MHIFVYLARLFIQVRNTVVMGIGRLARASRATYSKPWRHLMTEYLVDVYRDGKWWMANVAAADVLTQSRRLADIERNSKGAR